jgi:hypothetical protein
VDSRQQRKRRAFTAILATLKAKHGNGQYSFAEGVTRRAIRNIARKQAREVSRG